jgi:hypothetical protein
MDDYIAKPIGRKDLDAVIARNFKNRAAIASPADPASQSAQTPSDVPGETSSLVAISKNLPSKEQSAEI